MDRTEWILWAVASFIAVAALVRLMRSRRNQVMSEVHDQLQLQSRTKRSRKPTSEAAQKNAS